MNGSPVETLHLRQTCPMNDPETPLTPVSVPSPVFIHHSLRWSTWSGLNAKRRVCTFQWFNALWKPLLICLNSNPFSYTAALHQGLDLCESANCGSAQLTWEMIPPSYFPVICPCLPLHTFRPQLKFDRLPKSLESSLIRREVLRRGAPPIDHELLELASLVPTRCAPLEYVTRCK